MAKIVFLDGSEIRGKVGGKVYSRNASGAFVRMYVKGVNANTSKQQSVRNNFSTLSSAYRTLTDAQRATYENLRTFYTTTDGVGNVVTPTAPQLFNRLNGVLLQNGEINITQILTTCPAPAPLIGIVAAAPISDVSSADMFAPITFANGSLTVPADQAVIISATSAISAGISKVPARLFTRITKFNTGTVTNTTDIFANYTFNYSAPAVGDTIYMKFQTYNTNTGQITSEVISQIVVQL
jgi:hypothetical protein